MLAAVGTTTAYLDPLTIDVTLNGINIVRNSAAFEDKNLVSFENRLVELTVNLNVGEASATIRTNDLSHDYVHENSAYSS